MKNIIALLIVIPLLYWACEKPVTIKIPEKPSSLVINGWIGKDSVIILHIGKSRYSLAPSNMTWNLLETYTVSNAQVVVYEDNLAIDTLTYATTNYNYKSPGNRRIRQGHDYVVKVNAPGFT